MFALCPFSELLRIISKFESLLNIFYEEGVRKLGKFIGLNDIKCVKVKKGWSCGSKFKIF